MPMSSLLQAQRPFSKNIWARPRNKIMQPPKNQPTKKGAGRKPTVSDSRPRKSKPANIMAATPFAQPLPNQSFLPRGVVARSMFVFSPAVLTHACTAHGRLTEQRPTVASHISSSAWSCKSDRRALHWPASRSAPITNTPLGKKL